MYIYIPVCVCVCVSEKKKRKIVQKRGPAMCNRPFAYKVLK